MDTGKTTGTYRGLSISSLLFGILGMAFYWWVPMGMVLSLAGVTIGFIDGVMARRHSLDFRLGVIGVLLSAAAIALNIAIAVLGWQSVTLLR